MIPFRIPSSTPSRIPIKIPSSFVDSFDADEYNYIKIDSLDSNIGWNIYADTTSITNYTTTFKEGTGSLKINFTLITNRSAMYKTTSSKDISKMNLTGFWTYIGDNSKSSRFELRLGTDASNYKEYRNTLIPWSGWLYNEFNLSSPYTTIGSPNMSNIQYLWLAYYTNAGDINTYWLVDDLWAYEAPNFASPNWQYINNLNLYGIAEINVSGTQRLLLVNQNNRPNSSNHGRVLYNTMTPNSFNLSVKAKMISDDGSGWIRILWDFTDGETFTGVYISREYNRAGVEQLINAVRNFKEIVFTPTIGTDYIMDISVQGNTVTFYVNGSLIVTYNVTQPRSVGGFALESYAGSILTFPLRSSTTAFYYFNLTS